MKATKRTRSPHRYKPESNSKYGVRHIHHCFKTGCFFGGVVWVLCHINLCRLFNAKSIFMKIVLFQTIQFSISTQFKCKKTFLFEAIRFSQAVLILIYVYVSSLLLSSDNIFGTRPC